jgi:hypothetical protein
MTATTVESAPAMAGAIENWAEGRLVLPGGLLDGAGKTLQTVWVRQLTGADEERLADRKYRNGAHQVTDFLRHVLVKVEGLDGPVTEELVAGMCIGDRDYLLLRLRQIALGDKVDQVLRCPRTECGKKVDVEFLIGELPARRVARALAEYEFSLSAAANAEDDGSWQGAIRLPNGADHEAVLEARPANTAVSNTVLLSRILVRLGKRQRFDLETVRNLPLGARQEILRFLKKIMPGPDLTIEIQCPHCGADMSYPFDLHAFFLPNG